MESVSEVVFLKTLNMLSVASSEPSTSSGSPQILDSNDNPKFNPSMAIIIIVLISAFLFMGFFSIYVRRCTHAEENANTNAAQARAAAQAAAARPGQGLERFVVESLPLVGYSLVKGLKGGKELSECAVCLSDFEEDENLRLLPKCGHIFHPDCIDMWFHSHNTCPLCRASLVPDSEGGKEGSTYSEELQSWVSSRGTLPDGETFTIHEGPPVPPNGSILELLSREGADRILAESLRRDDERLDAGLSRREGGENGERGVEMRALNRALSKNSASFRRAARGLQVNDRIGAATDSAGAGVVDESAMRAAFADKQKKGAARSVGSSQSFDAILRRSRSVGSSGRYIRQLFGNYTDYFSPDSEQDGLRVDRTRLLGTEHRLPIVNPAVRRERSENELKNLVKVDIPVWEDIDLNGVTDAGAGGMAPSPISNRSGDGARSFNLSGSIGRKHFSGELPHNAGARRTDIQGETSGPLYLRRKGKESVEERTKSDRWTFGQSLRRTFSLRRTISDSREMTESSSHPYNDPPTKWYSHMIPATPISIPKKFASPWVGAMKIRRTASGGQDSLSSPNSPSSMVFPQSMPVADEQQQHHQQHHQQQPPAYPESIQIVTEP